MEGVGVSNGGGGWERQGEVRVCGAKKSEMIQGSVCQAVRFGLGAASRCVRDFE